MLEPLCVGWKLVDKFKPPIPLQLVVFWTDINRQGRRKHGDDITSRFAMSYLTSLPHYPLAGLHASLSRVDSLPSPLCRPPQPLVSLFASLVQHNALEEYPGGIPAPNLSDFRSRYAI